MVYHSMDAQKKKKKQTHKVNYQQNDSFRRFMYVKQFNLRSNFKDHFDKSLRFTMDQFGSILN